LGGSTERSVAFAIVVVTLINESLTEATVSRAIVNSIALCWKL